MGYTPTSWKYGDVITAERMNKLEQGVEDTALALQKNPNPNLLTNWYFGNPVNKNGENVYEIRGENYAFCMDLWRARNCRVTIKDACCNVSTIDVGNDYKRIQQLINGFSFKAGYTYTLSILAKVNAVGGTARFRPIDGSSTSVAYGITIGTASENYELFHNTFAASSSSSNCGVELLVSNSSNDYVDIDILAWKLELGNQQTLAHKEGDKWILNEIPDYAGQYAICSQYDPATGKLIGDGISPEMHRNIFRGENLGSTVTDAQKSAIQDGTFRNLFVGDYWVIDGVNWRIADMDYFYRCGDTEFTKHHLVIVPDKSLYNAKMNESDHTEGGYMTSRMRTENLTQAKENIVVAFGDLVLTHRDYFINAVTDGYGSAGAWEDSTVELMNEVMVYGASIRAAMNTGNPLAATHTTGKQQLALFALDPKKVNIRAAYWLRDVLSSDCFAFVNAYGLATGNYASSTYGVRPYFLIGV